MIVTFRPFVELSCWYCSLHNKKDLFQPRSDHHHSLHLEWCHPTIHVTANPHCPVLWYSFNKTDYLVCRTYNSATRDKLAQLGNALAILLAAIRKTANLHGCDTMSLIDPALIAQTQLTRGTRVCHMISHAGSQADLAGTDLPTRKH